MASENRDRGYDRIAGALANLGHEVSDQTLGNVLRRHGLPPAPERKRTTTWAAFVRTHLALSLELNPDEMANADIKQGVTTRALARTKLRHLRSVQRQPERVRKYFEHEPVRYAA